MKDDQLPPLVVDDAFLNSVEHALDAAFTYDRDTAFKTPDLDDEGPYVANAEFTLNQLLDFYSGYDPAKRELIAGAPVPIYRYPGRMYNEHDLIRALIKEVRRLRENE